MNKSVQASPGLWIRWCVALVFLMLSLILSIQLPLWGDFAPMRNLHLMGLTILMVLSAGNFPLLLIALFGLIVDLIHGFVIGSSSLILLIIVPFLQLMIHSAIRFSILRIWLVFSSMICLYQLGQIIVHLLKMQQIAFSVVLIDTLWAMILFPLLFAFVLMCIRGYSRSFQTPL